MSDYPHKSEENLDTLISWIVGVYHGEEEAERLLRKFMKGAAESCPVTVLTVLATEVVKIRAAELKQEIANG